MKFFSLLIATAVIIVFSSCSSSTDPSYTTVGNTYFPAHDLNTYKFRRSTYDKDGKFVDSATINVTCDSMNGVYNFKNAVKLSTVFYAKDVKTYVISLSDNTRYYIGFDNNGHDAYLGSATMDANNIKAVAKLTNYSSQSNIEYDDGMTMRAKTTSSVSANGVTYQDICIVENEYKTGSMRLIVSYFAKGVGLVLKEWYYTSGTVRTDVLTQANLN